MRPFFESFLEGFTGAGMFLGPRKVERLPLLTPMKDIPGPVVEEVLSQAGRDVQGEA